MNQKPLKKSVLFVLASALLLPGLGLASDQDPPEVTVHGLVRQHDAKVGLAYVHPDADFSVFERMMILDGEVAFRRGWEREQRRSIHRITRRDIEQIREGVAELLREVFTETLEEAGYEIVDEPADDVLLLRASIVDLDVSAPDTNRAGRSTTFVSSAGAATLFLELFDSVTHDQLAQFLDRQQARDFGTFQHSSRVTNSAEARRIFTAWAELLRDGLNEVHGRGAKAE
jgi:hypothetical protein